MDAARIEGRLSSIEEELRALGTRLDALRPKNDLHDQAVRESLEAVSIVARALVGAVLREEDLGEHLGRLEQALDMLDSVLEVIRTSEEEG